MTRTPARRRSTLLVGASAVFAVVLMNASPLLPGLHSDGVQYLEAARSMAELDGARIPIGAWARPDSTSFLSHYPPGFSAAMAPLVAAGVASPQAAVLVMALAAGLTVALAFHLAAAAGGGLAGGWIAAVLVGLNPEWVRLHTAVWSEPLYLALVLLTVLAMVRVPRRPGLHGLLALACTAVRYTGLAMAGVAAAVAWRAGGSAGERARRAVLAAGPSVAFFVGWDVLVQLREGSIRSAGLYPGWAGWLADLPGAFAGALVPAGGAWAGAVVLVVLAVVVARSELRTSGGWRALGWIVGLSVAAHLALLVVSRLFVDPRIPADARLLMPVLVLLAVVAGAALGKACEGSRGRTALIFALVGAWAVGAIMVVRPGLGGIRSTGQFYSSAFWFRSPLVGWTREHVQAGPLPYSNEPELLFLHTGRPARRLPVLGEDLTAFREAFRARPGPVVLVNPPHANDLPQPELLAGLGLELVVATPEGAVFWRP